MRALAIVAMAFVLTGAAWGPAWLDPHATAREASRLYADGKFDEAAAKYREALIDDPDSPLLQYNLADAAYRAAKYDDAVAALGKVPTSDADPARTARVAYNLGNAKYRLGAAAEASNPQQALALWAEALVAYRRAMGADPSDEDPKFNHELVEKKIADLRKKLEEQQKEKQDEKQDEQQQQQEKQDQQQPQDQQQGDEQQQKPQDGERQEQAEQQPEEQEKHGDEQEQAEQKPDEQPGEQEPQEPPQQAGEPPPQEPSDGQPGADGGESVAGEKTDEDMSEREAEALLDGQRDHEMRPDEMMRQMQRGRVAEPREDW